MSIQEHDQGAAIDQPQIPRAAEPDQPLDVIVIGAGFAGVYAVYKFSRQGMNVLGLESGGDVGGVWYHNRYPGARVDVESTSYCYFFSPEVYRKWKWSQRYAPQPELRRYIDYVADLYDLKKLIRFNSRVILARRLTERNLWEVSTADGKQFTCRFLVTAMGNLTTPKQPDIPGIDDFEGEWIQTSRWPDRSVAFEGKRVGVIGTGATGVQCITALAGVASHLTVFQRSPNFCMPARNRPLSASDIDAIADRFGAFKDELFASVGLTVFPTPLNFFDLDDAQRRAVLEARWQDGGHTIAFAFEGTQTNRTVNDFIANFLRDKIRQAVKNPQVAEDLCPYDHEFGLRRLPVTDDYYETYNRPNVSLVNVRKDPIKCFTKTGIELESGEHHALDSVLLAIGFESFTGALLEANIKNEHGVSLAASWRPGWQTLLGVMSSGYPNLFMICGPGGITLSANVVPSSEYHVDWIGDLIAHMDEHGFASVEPDKTKQESWMREVAEISAPLFVMKDDRPNRIVQYDSKTGKRVCMTYLGGFQKYRARLDSVRNSGFEGFTFDPKPEAESDSLQAAKMAIET